jgi:D-alanine-D-alanine ligase-like ATP-grasp enzyme
MSPPGLTIATSEMRTDAESNGPINPSTTTSRTRDIDPWTRVTYFLATHGDVGKEMAIRLDMTRALGVSHVWRRFREARRQANGEARYDGDVITAVYRGIWQEAANAVGAEVFDADDGGLEIRKSDSHVILRRKPVGLNDAEAVARAANKVEIHRCLAAAGLATTRHTVFELPEIAQALEFLAQASGSCVIKPAEGEGGYGVTCGVRTANDLVRAAVRASRLGPRILIEDEVHGTFFRFLVLDEEILSVVRRDPPSVQGDGRSTIEELIFAENRLRAGTKIALPGIRIDFDCLGTLKASGLKLESIVPQGEVVRVKTVISQNAPRENSIVEEAISDALREEVVRAAQALGLRLAGVDVVTSSLGDSLEAVGGVIIEVNGAPGLTYHYEVAQNSRIDPVAVPILREMLAGSRTVTAPATSEG